MTSALILSTTDSPPTADELPPLRYEYDVPVGPLTAQRFLDAMIENNRAAKQAKIPQFSRDMTSGLWRPKTGQTLKFDWLGRFVDGRNRMEAVKLSGCTIPFDIVYGLSAEAVAALDLGAARTFGDVAHMDLDGEGSSRAPMAVAALTRWLYAWDRGSYMGRMGRAAPSTMELRRIYSMNRGPLDEAALRGIDCNKAKLGTPSALAMGYVVCGRVDVDMTKAFYDSLITGANLPPFHPILTLRDRLKASRLDRLTRQEELALTIQGFNAYRKDQMPGTLKIGTKSGPLSNETFPLPI